MYSNKTNPKERVDAEGFELTSGRSPRRTSASIYHYQLQPHRTKTMQPSTTRQATPS